jgi:phosphatidylserine/phosphatidylglycerophosphate/cardiolipin synthase-like enzyme
VIPPRTAFAAALALCAAGALADDTGPVAAPAVTIRAAFTPHEQVDALLLGAIARARQSILVQAYTFSYRKFATALLDAHRRGVNVIVIADREQTLRQPTSEIPALAAARLPVYLDGQHEAAHNKVMVFDAGSPACAVATGSYNFTFSTQHRNAENLLIVRGDPDLCERYRRNWELHRAHALPYRR